MGNQEFMIAMRDGFTAAEFSFELPRFQILSHDDFITLGFDDAGSRRAQLMDGGANATKYPDYPVFLTHFVRNVVGEHTGFREFERAITSQRDTDHDLVEGKLMMSTCG